MLPSFSSMPATRMSRLYSSALRREQIAALVLVGSLATSSAAWEVEVVSSLFAWERCWVRKGVHCVQA